MLIEGLGSHILHIVPYYSIHLYNSVRVHVRQALYDCRKIKQGETSNAKTENKNKEKPKTYYAHLFPPGKKVIWSTIRQSSLKNAKKRIEKNKNKIIYVCNDLTCILFCMFCLTTCGAPGGEKRLRMRPVSSTSLQY
jgi:hypothetical protein